MVAFLVAVSLPALRAGEPFLVSEEWLQFLDESCAAERNPEEFWENATVYQKKGVVLEPHDAASGVISEGFWVLDQFTPGVVTGVRADERGNWWADVEFGDGRRNWEAQRVNVSMGGIGESMKIAVQRVGEQVDQEIVAEFLVEGLKLARGSFGSVLGEAAGGAVVVRFPVDLLARAVPRLGARVVRGPDWASGYVDGRGKPVAYATPTPDALEYQGTVEKSFDKSRVVEVLWDATGRRGVHRFDHNGYYDLRVVREGKRPSDEQITEYRKRLRQSRGTGGDWGMGEQTAVRSSMPGGQYGSNAFYGGAISSAGGVNGSIEPRSATSDQSPYGGRPSAEAPTEPLILRGPSSEPGSREKPPKPYVPDSADVPAAPRSAWVNRQDSSKFKDELFGEGKREVNDQKLFDGKVTLTLHPNCDRPDDEELQQIFKDQVVPQAVFADGPMNILVTGDSRDYPGSVGTVKDLCDNMVSGVKLNYPGTDWHDNSVYLINGLPWAVLEFTASQKGGVRRRFLLASTFKGKTQVTVTIRLEEKFLWKWLEVARLMVQSLRLAAE